MTDQTVGEEDTVTERTKIANRRWLLVAADSSAKEVKEEEANVVEYQFLGRTKHGVTLAGETQAFRHAISQPGTKPGMLEGFGALTLMGNVTNTWMTDKGDKAPSAFQAITDRWTQLDSGIWIDRTAQTGARVDRDKLAQAIVNVAAAKGATKELAAVRDKLEADAELLRAASNNPEIKAEYLRLVGREVKSVDELIAGI